MSKLLQVNREVLRGLSTATVATALFKRGLKNQFIQGVSPLKTGKPHMVGEAFTLRYIPAREDLNGIDVFKDPSHPQRVAVETCPEGSILVIDSRKNAAAASAGSILVTRLMVRGVAGIVTDGGFRDCAEIAALPISSYHQRPSAPTNLTLHQAIDVNGPIACGDVAIFPGDILLGDDDGVIVIPAHLVEEITKQGIRMTQYENFVLELVGQGASIKGLYPATDPENLIKFESWLAKNK